MLWNSETIHDKAPIKFHIKVSYYYSCNYCNVFIIVVIIIEIEKFNLNELYTFYRAFFHMDM